MTVPDANGEAILGSFQATEVKRGVIRVLPPEGIVLDR